MKKIAIVTGACGGIGFATVERLYRDGFRVMAMDVLSEETAKEKLSALDPARVAYFRGNLAVGADREALLAATLAAFGGVDTLVNVAGVAPKVRRDLLEMTEESYDFVMGINTKGTLFLTQLVANEMIRERDPAEPFGGFIVNISSCSAYTSSVSRGEYCVSKAGLSMVTTLFADRLAAECIPVNEICPGVIMTGMTEVVKAKYDKLIAEGLIPIARWGQPEDIANAVSALVSGQFGYTTGQSIAVDGGMHIRRL